MGCTVNVLAGKGASNGSTGFCGLFMALHTGKCAAYHMLGMAVGRHGTHLAIGVVGHAIGRGTTMTGIAGKGANISPFGFGINFPIINAWQIACSDAGVADAVAIGAITGQIVTAVVAK